MNKFDKFLRSKNGMIAIGALLLLIIVGAMYFGGQIPPQTGTAGVGGVAKVPVYPTYPMPAGGFTCLPTCSEVDAKMFVLTGSNMKSMSNTPVKVWIMVPGDQPSFKLGVFDGDTSKSVNNTVELQANGEINSRNGNWDNASTGDTTYTLYADPIADSSGQTVLNTWRGNDVMLNNAWWETTIQRNELAKAPNGHYYYRLEALRPADGKGSQVFKVRASGYVMTGQRPEWAVGLMGAMSTAADRKIIYPESTSGTNLGSKTNYNGDWQMFFYVPMNVSKFEMWDGDFDRGAGAALDTDDPNTDGTPAWSTSSAVPEGAGGAGKPNDDISVMSYRVSPSVIYEVLDPRGNPIYINSDPSGTEEWEKYTISANAADNPDVTAADLASGMYNVHIKGLDLFNAIWIGVNYPICDPNGGCPPPPWVENSCPRTIGYWKNNVRKIYIDNTTRGIQESKETLDWGFRNVALASPIFRSGINVKAPVAIANPVPLTPKEADAIMQKAAGNTMLDRALQQNLATWLNMATGKIGPYSEITLTGIKGGTYQGTLLNALLEAQNIILNGGDLERAKDIADMINNGQINVDPASNWSETGPNCTIFATTIPKDKQPPTHDKLPKAPKPQPEPVTPEQPSALACTAGNTYQVENTTNNPFYSVKFNYVSGTEVNNGGSETFKYTLPADVVKAMTSMQVEVKAATDQRTYDLACNFTDPLGCGLPVFDEAYAVSFNGATDNGDGTYTLSFTVTVFDKFALSHTSFSLPAGQTAGGVTENYTAECPAQ